MSKSLKNFIKVKDFLTHFSANDFRMFCIKHKYSSNIDYSEEEMKEVQTIIHKLRSFFSELSYQSSLPLLSSSSSSPTSSSSLSSSSSSPSSGLYVEKWSVFDHQLHDEYRRVEEEVVRALKDDFDTPKALFSLLSLISSYYKQLHQIKSSAHHAHFPFLSPTLSQSISLYLYQTLSMFGFHMPSFLPLSPSSLSSPSSSDQMRDQNDHRDQLANELVALRSDLRKILLDKSINDDQRKKELFKFCDNLRDERYPKVGIEIKDRSSSSSSWSWKL